MNPPVSKKAIVAADKFGELPPMTTAAMRPQTSAATAVRATAMALVLSNAATTDAVCAEACSGLERVHFLLLVRCGAGPAKNDLVTATRN